MKFKLKTTRVAYRENQIDDLKSIGFQFERRNDDDFRIVNDPEIEFNSVEEIVEFSKDWGELIIDEDVLEIYDDWRE